MSARHLLEIALRVLGIWFISTSITRLPWAVSLFFEARSTNYVLASVTTIIVQFLLGGTLIFLAPAIAAWFYEADSEGGESQLAVGPGDVYRTTCFVLGVYLLVATAHPAGRLVSICMRGYLPTVSSAADAVEAIIYASSGLLLVFGARRIAEMLSNPRYAPDTIGIQQISLAMLLILLVLAAVILGVARMMSLGAF